MLISRFLNTRSRAAARFSVARRQLVEVLEDPFEVAVARHSFAAVFSPDPGHPREVVARVAAQRRVLGVLHGRDPGPLEDAASS